MKGHISIFVLLLCLSGCASVKSTSCVLNNGNNRTEISIQAKGDEIITLRIREYFYVSYRYLADERIMNDIKRQIKDEYYLEDNYLISEKEEIIDDRYSLSKTVEELMGKGYGCR